MNYDTTGQKWQVVFLLRQRKGGGEHTMMWLGYGLMWLSVSAAVSVGLYVTLSAWCLWAFLLPALIKMSSGNKKGGKEDEIQEETSGD